MKLGKLSHRHLTRAGACENQVHLFRTWFPMGFVPTLANFEYAVECNLNVSWAASHLITDMETRFRLFRNVEERRWGWERARYLESYQMSVARCWWNMIELETGMASIRYNKERALTA